MLAVKFYGLYGYTDNKIVQTNSCIKQFHEFKKYFGWDIAPRLIKMTSPLLMNVSAYNGQALHAHNL